MLPFEFIIDGPPVSQQARRRERVHEWIEDVKSVARRYWPAGELPVAGSVMLTITYFYDTESMDIDKIPDVDNIPKPIADALKELVYLDDKQVTDVLCRKRDLNRDFRVENPSALLAEGLDRRKQFLHIIVEDAPDQGVIR